MKIVNSNGSKSARFSTATVRSEVDVEIVGWKTVASDFCRDETVA